MQKLHQHLSTRQTEPLTAAQVPMRSGGYGWAVDDWVRLHRFLVLGSEGGTYYVGERALSREAAGAVLRCIAQDGRRVVEQIVAISREGRAPKNDPALFALALAAKLGDEPTRAAAYRALPVVARIGTHLFHFVEYAKAFGGLGGNGFKRALGRWYLGRDAASLAYQAVKYQGRDGWTHRDLLRLGHPRAADVDQQAVLAWMVKGWPAGAGELEAVPPPLRIIWALERARVTTEVAEMVRLIQDHRLPHECVPSGMKGQPAVWEALLEHMPVGAMIRNLNKMTAVGLLTGSSAATVRVRQVLGDAERLRRARIHPMAVLLALKTYARGRGTLGKLSWQPVGRIVDALDQAFYLAFGGVEPTGKRICLALDVSGSMTAPISGARFISCREAAAAMALVTASVEPSYEILAFTCGGGGMVGGAGGGMVGGGERGGKGGGWWSRLLGRRGRPAMTFGRAGAYCDFGIAPLAISPRQRLDDVVRATSDLPFGGTDCALPMRWALANRVAVDAFVIYTDNESWAGEVHVDQALRDYRQGMGLPARLVAVALSGDRFSVANPEDAGQMDVVGFDAAAPAVISSFIRE